MKTFLYILICASLASCITQEKCNERYPSKDSIYTVEKIVCVPDTFWFPEESYWAEDTSPCPPQIEYHKESVQGSHKVTIDISKGKIKVVCHSDSVQKIVNDQEKIIATYQSKKAQTIIQEVTAWYDIAFRWWFGISWLIILGVIFGLWMSSRREI